MGMITGFPPSITAAHEFVVSGSIPIILPRLSSCFVLITSRVIEQVKSLTWPAAEKTKQLRQHNSKKGASQILHIESPVFTGLPVRKTLPFKLV
jgi:hypothetical protein